MSKLKNITDVVTSTIPLFGSVVSHSFISSTYVRLCKLSTEPLEQNICVATTVGNVVTCSKCGDSCPICYRREESANEVSSV
jgi:hypothetical protein